MLRIAGDTAELAAFTPVSEEADAVLRAAFPMPIAGSPVLEMIQRGEMSEIIDTEAEIYAHHRIRNIARARGFRSILYVPLKSHSGTIGAINVTRAEPGSFAQHHDAVVHHDRQAVDEALLGNVLCLEKTRAVGAGLCAHRDGLSR